MTPLCANSDSTHLLLFSLLYDNLLSFIFFLYSHPLHLAYLLYFSPYIFHLLSFLFPLLLTTSILLLLFSLHSMLEGEVATACLLEQLVSVVVATVGNVFEWEFETMAELYKNAGLTFKGEEDPAEICRENSINGEVLKYNFGSGERVDLVGSSFEPLECFSLNCEVKGDPLELPLKNCVKSELLESHVRIGDRISLNVGGSFEPEEPSSVPETPNDRKSMGELCDLREGVAELSLEKPERNEILESHSEIGDQVNSKGCSFVPQTPDRISEILVNSSLARRVRQRGGALESLSRSGSMRIPADLYKHSSLNCEGPNEIFSESCDKIELLKPQFEKGGSFKSRYPSGMQESLNRSPSVRIKDQHDKAIEGLQREGSMRKEREWKRTLACKLYEERMTFKLGDERTAVEGAEEMDLLWEAYEADADEASKVKNKGKNGKKEAYIKEEDEDEDEEDESVGHLCCLQALRLSTGKMNLGVGRPNLVKIFKGIGFFHRSSSRSRKG